MAKFTNSLYHNGMIDSQAMNSRSERTTESVADAAASRSRQCVPFANEMLICLISIVAFLIVWPVGEYAILDDWAFAKSLEHLHNEHRLVVLDWNAMTLIGHLLWGLLFTKVFGFSFFITKVSTFCAGVLLVICVQRFVRNHGASSSVALLAGLTLLLNPLFLAHMFMYMTDVTSLMWQWFAFGALGVSLRRSGCSSTAWAMTGSLCWGLAYLTRQHGIVIPVAFLVYLILFERPLPRPMVIISALAPGTLVAIAGSIWQRMSQNPTDAMRVMSTAVIDFLLHPPLLDLPYLIWSYSVYAGLFVAPMTLAFGWRGIGPCLTGWRSGAVLSGAALGLNLFIHYTLNGWYFPYVRNVVTPWGMFHPNEFAIQEQTAPVWSLELGIAIGLIGVLSAIWLIAVVCRPMTIATTENGIPANLESRRASRLLLLVLFLQAAYALVTAPFLFDRHLLLFAPTVISMAAIRVPIQKWSRRIAPIAVLVVYGAYGVICSHDIHAVSRGVFLEGTRLLASGVDAEQIDAGYAFDGWFMYERSAKVKTPPLIQIAPWWPSSYPMPTLQSYGSPWWVGGLSTQIRPGYVITAGAQIPVDMFNGRLHFEETESRERIQTFWPWKEQRVRVFRTIPSTKSQ